MDHEPKTPRRRVANFTADEKALLAQLIKKRPIVESKVTDGKSVIKKKSEWNLITQEFNCHANVHKRDTVTLKRAWDNMKAFTRKARATERGNYIRTGGGPSAPPPTSQHGAIISMVEEAAPVFICEIKNNFDSDGAILNIIENKQEEKKLPESNNKPEYETLDILELDCQIDDELKKDIVATQTNSEIDCADTNSPFVDPIESTEKSAVYKMKEENSRKTSDYIRREAVLRIKSLENRNRMETQMWKSKLRVAALDEETSQNLLCLAEERRQHFLWQAALEEERSQNLLQLSIIELEKAKKSLQ